MASRLKDIKIISDAGGSAVFSAKKDVIYNADKVDEHVEGFMIAASKKLEELKQADPSLGINFVVTSILDGVHKGKAHGKGLAIDLQIPEEYRFNGRAHESPIWKFWNTGEGRKLREEWGMYMVQPYHGTAAHFHMEYDPTGKKQGGNIINEERFTPEFIEAYFKKTGHGKVDPKTTEAPVQDLTVAPVTFSELPEVARSFVYDVKNEQQVIEKAQEKKEVSKAEEELIATEDKRNQILQEIQAIAEREAATAIENDIAQQEQPITIQQQRAEYIENPFLSQNQLIPDEFIFEDGGGVPNRYKNKGFTKVGAKKQAPKGAKHKWEVLAKKGDSYKIVKGGYRGMKDFSQHKNKERQKRFWDRMGGKNSSKAKDPFSPLYWHKRFGTWEDGGVVLDYYMDGGDVGEKIKILKEEGYPQDQAVAIALNMEEKGYYEDGDEVELTDQEIAILLANGYTIEGLE